MPTSFLFIYPETVALAYFKKIESNSPALFKVQKNIENIFMSLLNEVLTANIFSYLTKDDCTSLLAFIECILDNKTPKVTSTCTLNNEQIKKLLTVFIYVHNEALLASKKLADDEGGEIYYLSATQQTISFMIEVIFKLQDAADASNLHMEYCVFMHIIFYDIESILSNISTGLFSNYFQKHHGLLSSLFKNAIAEFHKAHHLLLPRLHNLTHATDLAFTISKSAILMPFYETQYHAALGEDIFFKTNMEMQLKICQSIESIENTNKNLEKLSINTLAEHKALQLNIENDEHRSNFIKVLLMLQTPSKIHYVCADPITIKSTKNLIEEAFNNLHDVNEISEKTLPKINACIIQLQLSFNNDFFNNEEVVMWCKKNIIKLKIILFKNPYNVISQKINNFFEIYLNKMPKKSYLLSSLKPAEEKKLDVELKKDTSVKKHKKKAKTKKKKTEKNSQLEAEVFSLPELTPDIEEQIKDIEIESLIEQYTILQAQQKKELQEQIDKEKILEEAILCLEKNVTSSEQELSISTKEQALLEEQSNILQSQYCSSEQELKKIKETIVKSQAQVNALTDKNELLKKASDVALSDLESFLKIEESHKKTIKTLSQETQVFENKENTLKQKIQCTQLSLERAQASEISLKTEINEFIQKSTLEIQELQNEVTELEKNIQVFQQNNAQLYNAYLSTQQALQQLHQKKQDTDQTNFQLYQDRVNAIRIFYNQCNAHIADLALLLRIQHAPNILCVHPPVPDFMPFYKLHRYPVAPLVPLPPVAITSGVQEHKSVLPAHHYRYPQ